MFYKMIENKCKEWYSSENCTVRNLIEYIEKTGQMRDAQIEAIKVYRKYLSDYDSLILTDREFTVNVPAVAKEWSSVITRGTVLKSTIDPPANTGCSILIFPLVDTCTDLKCQRRFGIRKNVSAF